MFVGESERKNIFIYFFVYIYFYFYFLRITRELSTKVAELQNEVKEKLLMSDLREKADVGPLNEWLVSLRRKAITRSLQEFPEGNTFLIFI